MGKAVIMASFFTRVASTINSYTGQEGYRFGDVARATTNRIGATVLKYTGKEDYHFGDISRTTIDRYYGWKQGNGTPALEGIRSRVLSYTAKDHYVIGDITLATVRHFINLFRYTSNHLIYSGSGSKEDNPNLSDESSKDPSENIDKLIEVFSHAFWSPDIPQVKIQNPRWKIPSEVIWNSFWDRSYELSIQCLKLGILVIDDFLNLETFLFIGLPSLVLIEAVHRSVDKEGIILATGIVVTELNCPNEFAELFKAVKKFKGNFFALEFNNFELCWLKLNLLFACCDKIPPQDISSRLSEERIILINSIKAKVTQVAIGITQMSVFKNKFGGVITRVIDEISETEDG